MKRLYHLDSFRIFTNPKFYSAFLIINYSLLIFNCFAQQPTQEWVSRYSVTGNCGNRGMCLDKFGNSYVTGNFQINDRDIVTVKYNTNGIQQWAQVYDDTTLTMDESTGISVDSLGNVFVIGVSWNNFTPTYYLLLKYNTNGVLQWIKKFNYSTMGFPNGISHDSFGNIYVAGNNDTTGIIAKFNTDGDSVWVRRYYELSRETYFGKVLNNDSNIYIMGSIRQNFPLNSDFLTLKYDSEGNLRWAVKYLGPQPFALDEVKAIDIDRFGNTFIAGIASSGSPSFNDIVTIKYNWNGVQQWAKIYSGPANLLDSPNEIKTDRTGNVIVTGFSHWSGALGGDNYTTIKYNSDGDTVWTRIYNGPSNDEDIAYGLAVDDSDNIYVTGRSLNSVTSYDIATIKYDDNGQQKWLMVYDGFSNDDIGQFIKIDNNSNVYVSGFSINIWADLLTLKYSQIVGISIINTQVSDNFQLFQNYPNPFNPSTKINFSVSKYSFIQIKIFDILGRIIETPVNEELNSSTYELSLNASAYSSGVYFYQLISDNLIIDIKKFVVLK